MSYPPPGYPPPGYPGAPPGYPPYDPASFPYGYPPAQPRPDAPAADPYYGYPPPQPGQAPPAQPQPGQPAPGAPPAQPPAQAPPGQPGQAPPPDPYAQAHYDYYRQYYYPSYPGPPPADPAQAQAHAPPAAPGPQPASAPPPGYPPAGAPPPGYSAPAPTGEAPAAPAGYPPYPAYPGYPGYDPTRPPDPYAHYAHYPPPGYPAYPPPGYPPYGYPPPHAPHAHPPPGQPLADSRDRRRRTPSPRRDRKRVPAKAPERPEKKQKVEPDSRAKLLQHAQNKAWSLFWLEGIDPPTRGIGNSNVTLLILTKGAASSASSFGFLMAASRQPQKQKDRQRECARDLLGQVEQLLAGKSEADLRSWCQIHDPPAESNGKEEDFEKLKSSIASRLATTGSKSVAVDLQWGSTSSCVLVSASAFEEEEKKDAEVDLSALNFFSPDAAAQLEEARKLGGLLRLQWHLSVVKASRSIKEDKGDKDKDQQRPLALGIGFATDEALAKARALRAAEVRAEVLTEAMFSKPKS